MQSIPVNEFSSTEHEFRLEESFTVLLGKYNTSLSEVFSLLLPQSTSGNLKYFYEQYPITRKSNKFMMLFEVHIETVKVFKFLQQMQHDCGGYSLFLS